MSRVEAAVRLYITLCHPWIGMKVNESRWNMASKKIIHRSVWKLHFISFGSTGYKLNFSYRSLCVLVPSNFFTHLCAFIFWTNLCFEVKPFIRGCWFTSGKWTFVHIIMCIEQANPCCIWVTDKQDLLASRILGKSISQNGFLIQVQRTSPRWSVRKPAWQREIRLLKIWNRIYLASEHKLVEIKWNTVVWLIYFFHIEIFCQKLFTLILLE